MATKVQTKKITSNQGTRIEQTIDENHFNFCLLLLPPFHLGQGVQLRDL
jgi:hypothetical protein